MVLDWLLRRLWDKTSGAAPRGGDALLSTLVEITNAEVLGYLEACDLCRVEACSRRFADAGETVARRLAARRDPLGRCAALAPAAPGQSWKQALRLIELGHLLAAPRRGESVEVLERLGWKECYDECCDHKTSDADLDGVPAAARAVFVAATQGDDFWEGRRVVLGAWGPRDAVLRAGDDRAPARELRFYRVRGESFGFEFRGGPQALRDDRLHWNLDAAVTTGSWVAGEALDLGETGGGPWRKLLLYRD